MNKENLTAHGLSFSFGVVAAGIGAAAVIGFGVAIGVVGVVAGIIGVSAVVGGIIGAAASVPVVNYIDLNDELKPISFVAGAITGLSLAAFAAVALIQSNDNDPVLTNQCGGASIQQMGNDEITLKIPTGCNYTSGPNLG